MLLSLPTPAAVRRVVDFSTIGPAAARTSAETLAAKDIAYVDAPASGGVPGAASGTLAIIVASSTAQFNALIALLGTLGKRFHLGDQPGQAQVMKLANNLLSAATPAIASKATAMGVKCGLAP